MDKQEAHQRHRHKASQNIIENIPDLIEGKEQGKEEREQDKHHRLPRSLNVPLELKQSQTTPEKSEVAQPRTQQPSLRRINHTALHKNDKEAEAERYQEAIQHIQPPEQVIHRQAPPLTEIAKVSHEGDAQDGKEYFPYHKTTITNRATVQGWHNA